MARWLLFLQILMSAAAAVDATVNVLALPWLWRLLSENKVSSAFQGVLLTAIAAEMGTAFVLASLPSRPLPVIAGLVAASLVKFALLVIAP